MSSVPLTPGFAAVPYVRLSTAVQLKGYNPDEMVAACVAEITRLGGTALPAIVENEKGDDWDRQSFYDLMDRAERREIQAVMGFDTSRVARKAGMREWFKDQLKARGCALLYTTVSYDDTPEGHAQEGFQSLFDQYEHEKIRYRTQMGLRGKRQRGEVIGSGPAPYGLSYTHNANGKVCGYEHDEPAYSTLRWIIETLRTETLAAICTSLNERAVPTPGGKGHWAPSTIVQLLENETYLGEYTFGKRRKKKAPRGSDRKYLRLENPSESVTRLTVPYVWTYAELAAARDAMGARKRSRRGQKPEGDDPYILRGMLTCQCGGVLSTAASKGIRRYYSCLRRYPPKQTRLAAADARCPMPQVPAELLERHVWAAFRDAVTDFEAVGARLAAYGSESAAAKAHATQVEHVENEIARLERLIEKWNDDIEQFDADSVTVVRAREKLPPAEREVKALRQSRKDLTERAPVALTAADIEATLATLRTLAADVVEATPARQRELLRRFKVGAWLRLTDGAEGVQLGRHRYAISLDGMLGDIDSGVDPSGSIPLFSPARVA